MQENMEKKCHQCNGNISGVSGGSGGRNLQELCKFCTKAGYYLDYDHSNQVSIKNSHSTGCCCHNEDLEIQKVCMNCGRNWMEKMESHERMMKCSLHYGQMAFCGGGERLCDYCENAGFYLDRSKSGFGPLHFPEVRNNSDK